MGRTPLADDRDMKRRASLAFVGALALVLLMLGTSVQAASLSPSSLGQPIKPDIKLHLWKKAQTGTGPVTLEAQLIIAGGTPPITVRLELWVDMGQGGKLHPAAVDRSELKPGNETWYTWTLSEEGQYKVWAHAKATNAAGVVEIDDDNDPRLTFRIGAETPPPIPITYIAIPIVVVVVAVVLVVFMMRRRQRKPMPPPPVVQPPLPKPATPSPAPPKPAVTPQPAAQPQPPPPVVPPPPTPAAPPTAPAPTVPTPGAAMFCPSCGARLPPGATFCANCGAKI